MLDEDELNDALKSNLISKDEYDDAYKTCKKIINNVISNKDFLLSFTDRYYKMFK